MFFEYSQDGINPLYNKPVVLYYPFYYIERVDHVQTLPNMIIIS